MAYQPHALPAAQVFSPPVAYQPPVPVLLEFVFGEQGSKQAADLRDKLPPAVKPLILDGFSVFEGLTAAQSSALHFHGGLVPLIAACWGTAHCPLGGLAAQLQQSSTSVEKLSKDYTEQLQEQISKADVFGRLVDDDDEVVVQALKISVILKSLWPQDIKKIWKHNQHFRHFRLASSSISDPLSTWDPLPPAQNVAILVSKSQTAAVLLDMMEDANLEQQTHNAFAEMLQKHASETWQQASLVSVLVQNPEDIKKITDSIKDTSVELLLTLEMECRTLKVHNTEGRLNDVSKRHTISIQLYAYAKLQIEGTCPDDIQHSGTAKCITCLNATCTQGFHFMNCW